jgi:S1 RNA binding domain/Zc3h12a-like Ribonuclease NYN domain
MKIKHVIIDGSNIATEGRDAPSLAQLDEAVQAFIEEYSPDYVTVVVDATFPNRIDAKERKTYEDAVNANELVTPPAGAIGRGDAFVLQIAKRAGASILSNDSFQEFHGEYPWLFEKGRLIGGKPVPHVGWVFMERAPVRGPTSRRAVSEARKVAKAAERVAKTTTKAAATTEAVAAPDSDGEDAGAKPARKRRSRAKAAEPVAATVGDQIAAEAALDAAAGDGEARGRGSRVPDPYNEALPFIDFVSRHPVGSEVDAEIERFSSHGAYVMVGEARAYVPLRHLADPAPRSAKEMLRVGETRRFVVVTIDPPRRGIDLAVPGVVEVPAAPPAADDGTDAVEIDDTVVAVPGDAAEPAPTRAEARRAAAAAARAARAAVEGAAEPAAKAPARKKAAARKAATAEKAPAKRTRGRKAAATDAVQAGAQPEAAEPAPSRKRAARKSAAAAEAPAEAPAGAGGAPTATTSPAGKATKKAAKAAKPTAAKATKATRSTATRAAKPTKAPTAAKATKATRSSTADTATKAAKAAKAPRRPRAAPAGDDAASAGPEAEVVPLPANGAAASAAGA